MTGLEIYLKPLTDKNAQLLTCGIFYCRDSAEINGCGSLQPSSWLDSEVLRNRQQKHTAVRCVAFNTGAKLIFLVNYKKPIKEIN